jgi:hypothetical protein
MCKVTQAPEERLLGAKSTATSVMVPHGGERNVKDRREGRAVKAKRKGDHVDR